MRNRLRNIAVISVLPLFLVGCPGFDIPIRIAGEIGFRVLYGVYKESKKDSNTPERKPCADRLEEGTLELVPYGQKDEGRNVPPYLCGETERGE